MARMELDKVEEASDDEKEETTPPPKSKELFEDDHEEKAVPKKKQTRRKIEDYEDMKKRVMRDLNVNSKTYLEDAMLEKYGPKYHYIMKTVESSAGTCLIYSQFRELEGLGVMQALLKSKGFAELECKKTKATGVYELVLPKDLKKPFYVVFTDDKDKNKVLMDLFNSEFEKLSPKVNKQLIEIANARGFDLNSVKNLRGEIAKVMMITKSGSEGISLKNVRQVHIMEPYWNDIRIKQVIGRAVRSGSHLALPKDERFVDVYMYLMTFDKNQKKITSVDGMITTDEYVQSKAEFKASIIGSIQSAMQSVAVDCALNKDNHPNVDSCMTLPSNMTGYLYKHQDASLDDTDEVIQKKTKKQIVKREVKTITKKDKQYSYFVDTYDIFDKDAYESKAEMVFLGKLIKDENGNLKPRFYREPKRSVV
jgi:hypothetical protein